MTDLAQFLLDCIADDERVAREAADEIERLDQAFEIDQQEWRRWSRPFASASASGPVAAFVNAQTPARVLAECAAKRAIVYGYQAAAEEPHSKVFPPRVHMMGLADGLELAMKAIAQPYRDRDGYRSEWDVR